ncbi:hypothetical protein CLV51_10577 [Chitinophaga niastensis]|uniref:Peptidase C39-like domain-containing protein n=1 Tax=Chitinophaga niastensis TaxID=536980 RepID=A0A2P8HET7_CHINA|nr:hypothetical protein [Chitinophaga niastensis]PSL44705.1 hypothetical protein CLV51_10577 [Chitinophaga niastensis]
MQKLKKLSLSSLENEAPVLREIDQEKIFGGSVPITTLPFCYFDSLEYIDQQCGGTNDENFYLNSFGHQYGYGYMQTGVTAAQANTFTSEYFNTTPNLATNQWQGYVANGGMIMTDIYQGVDSSGQAYSHAVVITGYNSTTGQYSYHDATDKTSSTAGASFFNASLAIGVNGTCLP